MLPRLATLSALFAGAIPFGHMRMKTLKIDLSLPACRSSLPRCICDVMLAITKRRNDDVQQSIESFDAFCSIIKIT